MTGVGGGVYPNASAGFDSTTITGQTEKTTPVAGDMFIIADSEDSNNLKKVDFDNIGGGVFTFKSVDVHTSTTWFLMAVVPFNLTVTNIYAGTDTGITQNDSSYWTWVVGVDTDNSGSIDNNLTSSSDLNTTKLTGGQSWSTRVYRELNLTATTADLDLNTGESITFHPQETGTPSTMRYPLIVIKYKRR